jgi:Cu+-exporting ATPase
VLEERRRGEVEIPVTGMTCASCVRRVEKALGKVEGVEGASVNLATEKARVSFDPEVADPRTMAAAIEKAGYGVREMPAPASAPPTKMPKNMPSGTPPRPADGGAGAAPCCFRSRV